MDKTPEQQPGMPSGQQVIEETGRLLRQMRFSQNRGVYAEGQRVAVSIDPRWNEDDETIRVLISCYAFGHRRVDWAQLPVHVLPEGRGAGVYAIVRLDVRGQAVIPRLPPGEYRLSLRRKPTRVEPVLSRQLERLAAQGETDLEERRVWSGEEEDGTLLWTFEETEDGDVQIAFETNAQQLAGHVVIFSLVDPDSKQVQYHRRLILETTRTPGKWEGWCSLGARAEFQGPYELSFEVVPPGEIEE
jgi:hypothetical protein